MFRELIRVKDLPGIVDSLVETDDFSLKWQGNDRLVEIPDGLTGRSLNDLIERFKLNPKSQNVMVVTSLFVFR